MILHGSRKQNEHAIRPLTTIIASNTFSLFEIIIIIIITIIN